jgi:two-component sensor histidine kinase
MRFAAWRGLSDAYRKAVDGHSPWTSDVTDPTPICIDDVDAADLDASLKATVKAEGIGALAFIPLTVKGKLVGKFMTYYKVRHVLTGPELALAVTIARQLGFSLERLRAEEERQKAEDAKELLLAESRHRIKNTLATVQAIAGQTLRNGGPDALDGFIARLHALGEAHDLLTTENWDWAPLREVVTRAVKPFQASQPDRFTCEGPAVWLPAQTSLTLTMCLHELATNAVKYGALSNGSGRVQLGWEPIDDGDRRKVRITWQETGGPPVAVPQRKGFGSLLIASSSEGESAVDYRPDGVRCLIAP